MLLLFLVIAAGVWAATSLLGRWSASDPTTSVRGFSEALTALERAPRRFGPPGGRRP